MVVGMRTIAIVLVTAATAVPSRAGPVQFESGPDRVALLELYTSQGCSSCPPAEAMVGRLKHVDELWAEIVPVVFHVDYWDRLGWEDPFGSAAHSQRQRRYARELGMRSVYTPGFFLNGEEWRGFFRGRAPEFDSNERPGNLLVRVKGEGVAIRFTGDSAGARAHVVLLGFGFETKVSRGENRGRSLSGDFVVLEHQTVELDGDGRANLSLQARHPSGAKGLALAAWVAKDGALEPIQATGGWLGR